MPDFTQLFAVEPLSIKYRWETQICAGCKKVFFRDNSLFLVGIIMCILERPTFTKLIFHGCQELNQQIEIDFRVCWISCNNSVFRVKTQIPLEQSVNCVAEIIFDRKGVWYFAFMLKQFCNFDYVKFVSNERFKKHIPFIL